MLIKAAKCNYNNEFDGHTTTQLWISRRPSYTLYLILGCTCTQEGKDRYQTLNLMETACYMLSFTLEDAYRGCKVEHLSPNTEFDGGYLLHTVVYAGRRLLRLLNATLVSGHWTLLAIRCCIYSTMLIGLQYTTQSPNWFFRWDLN